MRLFEACHLRLDWGDVRKRGAGEREREIDRPNGLALRSEILAALIKL
jgi:hypothetical protein